MELTEKPPSLALYGRDLLGNVIKPKSGGPVAERFLIPPFTVLDARRSDWQNRKRAWIKMGICGEIGRDAKAYNIHDWADEKAGGSKVVGGGTSIFDPVLVELIYRWFSPEGAQIIDPFAGGSVRGIVASALNRGYWGCDLRQEQIDANEKQADDVFGPTVNITISAASMRQPFHPCTPDFVKEVCGAKCEEKSTGGILVTIHPTEVSKFRGMGAEIEGGFIKPDERGKCPFTLSVNDTLIVRNRYRSLKCFKAEGSLPVYIAHAWSLQQIFGDEEAKRITEHLNSGGDDIVAKISSRKYAILRDNDSVKKTRIKPSLRPIWICGDSLKALEDAPEADLVFSCPPYGDLERYSEDCRDLSTMEWHTFVPSYKRIIMRSVQKMKPDSFACFVVSNFRKSDGFYRDLVGATVEGFEACGSYLYNEAVLITPVGSAAMRVTRQFKSSRKLVKTHQNVLIFCKGDWKKATMKCCSKEKTDV